MPVMHRTPRRKLQALFAGGTPQAVRASLSVMASPRDSESETVRKNLNHYRLRAGLTQEEASQISGVAVDSIRRYEGGKMGASAASLRAIAKVYGCRMEDFYDPARPEPDLTNRPVIFLRTLPGVTIDHGVMGELEKLVEKANALARTKKRPAKR